jgi:hypothetical protein
VAFFVKYCPRPVLARDPTGSLGCEVNAFIAEGI